MMSNTTSTLETRTKAVFEQLEIQLRSYPSLTWVLAAVLALQRIQDMARAEQPNKKETEQIKRNGT
jgi:hypothetical protein